MKASPTYAKNYISSRADGGPRLVLGTSGLGGVWGPVNEDDSVKAILMALENRIFSIDTAPSYANAEAIVGKALKHWKGVRPHLSTKVGRLKAYDAHTTQTDYSDEGIRRSLEQSLDTLGVNFVDLLFLHEPQLVPKEEIPRILSCLLHYKDRGLICKIGIGGNMPEYFKPFMGKDKFEVVSGFLRMNACNLDVFREDMQFFSERNITYYNASVLHFGLLGDRFSHYWNNFEQERDWLKENDLQAAERLEKISRKYATSLSTLAFRYAISIEEADKVVIGPTKIEELKELLQAWKMGPLPLEIFEEITDSIEKYSFVPSSSFSGGSI
jgi:aryl-alcohol dehydrogenase-like predicted oxidoreductase